MELLEYLNGKPKLEQISLSSRCGTTINYVRKAISKGQIFGPALCVSFEKETSGAVKRWDLRPDDWHLIWPELRLRPDAPPVVSQEIA